MREKAKQLARSLLSSYGYSPSLHAEAADLILNMAAELEQVKRERDAAVRDLRLYAVNGNTCAFCNNNGGCAERQKHLDSVASCWEWRGLCKENGGNA